MRLDLYLAASGLAKSRSYAGELIKKGLVTVDGKIITKPSFAVQGEDVRVSGEIHPFVGRGGMKLEGALSAFAVDVAGFTVIDVGASTGGFTDCVLKRGAARVIAVDSGHGQLDTSLVNDKRVVNLEGFNARDISPETIGEICDMAVCDLSFISQTYIIDNVYSVLKDGGIFITLIKPQFECGKEALSKGGIVKDKKQHRKAVEKVLEFAKTSGFSAVDIMRSPIEGGDGNKEFLACFIKNGGLSAVTERKIEEVTR